MPITVDLAANAFILIGSSCFIILINQGVRDASMASFVFSIGVLAFVRLLVVCCVGDLPGGACRSLTRLIYECKSDWTVQEWLSYREIKRQSGQFRVCMSRIVFVQQSTILSIFGFVLQYIVILLQTETYLKSNGTNAENTTSLENSTIDH